jgi:hypothetical protein
MGHTQIDGGDMTGLQSLFLALGGTGKLPTLRKHCR